MLKSMSFGDPGFYFWDIGLPFWSTGTPRVLQRGTSVARDHFLMILGGFRDSLEVPGDVLFVIVH